MSGVDLGELHWMMGLLQNIDVGLCVLDRDFRIHLWNSFMENHSARKAQDVKEKVLFDLFPEIDRDWLKQKLRPVRQLHTQVFTHWEQRPYLFRFASYRPITGRVDFMYQNVTMIPLSSTHAEIEYVGILVYDVTDVAGNRLAVLTANRELERLSRTDRLTQLYNRGYWEECLQREFKRVQRNRAMVATLVMFDIDHFKRVNDSYGHPAGDEVIRATASALMQQLRETDIGGRYGGEEFTAILVGADAQGGMIFAERLRQFVAEHTVMYEGGEIAYSISLGVAPLTEDVEDIKTWITRADQALYRSKEGGRNQVTLFGS